MGRRDRVEDLLYDGESVRESVDLDDARVVVTSHRVLAFTPEMDGANFQQADRPNVEGVGTGARTESRLLEPGLRIGVVGVVLLGTGLVVDFGSLVGSVDLGGGAGGVGIGGMLGPVRSLLGLVRDLDQYLQLFGALALLLAVGILSVYWYLREPTLTIAVAGSEDIHVPRVDDAAAVDRIERALTPDGADGDGTPRDGVPGGGPSSGSGGSGGGRSEEFGRRPDPGPGPERDAGPDSPPES
jgi:hypothetical protein